ncbi:MAG: hypothetical protein Q4E59_05030 [Bacteroidales bacterium]|nr:hypothetical protein [Bacteroidales bacterium]
MDKFSVFMATSLLIVSAANVQADVIGLKTSKAAGETMTLALNNGVSAQLTWSNGNTETITFDGFPTTVTVVSDSLTISSDTKITCFYAPSDGLVSLNTSGASRLQKLLVPNNSLTALDLSSNTALTELNCQTNDLTALTITSCPSLQVLNCAQNELGELTYSAPKVLTSLICADNQLDTIASQTSLNCLEALWCQNNDISALNLSSSSSLRSLMASSTGLTALTLCKMPTLAEVWLENNALQTLDFSAGSPLLRCVSVNNNALTDIDWDANCSGTLAYFYGQNNALFFNSLPTPSDGLVSVIEPQDSFYLFDAVNVNESVDLSDLMAQTGFGNSSRKTYVLTTGAGETLKRGSSADYYNTSTNWTFYTAHSDVVMAATAAAFGITLYSKPFDIVDPTGISNVTTADGMSFATAKGTLKVTAAKAGTLSVYDAGGACVISKSVGSGTSSYSLPTGVYMVNGTKVIVP